MAFQIASLDFEPFAHLFIEKTQALALKKTKRQKVIKAHSTPCRVSLIDAGIGEEVVLTNFQHQNAPSPFQASHAIYVRKNAERAALAANEIPDMLEQRQLSLRAFDANHDMVDAALVKGPALGSAIDQMFDARLVAYLHIHFAARGCYAARVVRV